MPSERYRQLVENGLGLICAHDLDGNLLFVNAAAAQALGYTPDEGVGKNLSEFLASGTRHLFADYLKRIRDHQVDEGLMRVVDRFGRERVWMYRNVRSEEPGERPHVVGHALDITERVATEQSLRVSEEAVTRAYAALEMRMQARADELLMVNDALRAEIVERRRQHALRGHDARCDDDDFRLLADAAPVMMWMSGPDKQCIYFNHQWLEFTGRSMQAELGAGWSEGVHPEDLTRCLDTYTQAFDRRERFRMEYRLRRSDGEFRWMLDAGVPRTTRDGALVGYIGSCIDITEHKLSQEVLAGLSRRLILAHESERTWIARELQDDLAQRTVALAMQLHTLARVVPSETNYHGRIQELVDLAANLGRDIEAISRRLHSSRLEYLGITSAAAGLCKELSEQHNMQIAFADEHVPEELPKDVALALFRVLQEALANAVKHSGVRDITVALRGNPDEIALEVVDHGIGFDAEAAKRNGLGLIGMQERLNLVSGTMCIESRPGTGTTVRARVPLRHVLPRADPRGVGQCDG